MELSTSNIISLYAPLAGVVVLAFWSGVLTQRVADLVRRVLKLEEHNTADTATAVQLGVMGADIKNMKEDGKKVEREIAGIHRALANIAAGHTAITKFEQDIN